MADSLRTLADVAIFDDLDDDFGLSEVLDSAPTVQRLYAHSVAGQTYKTVKRTANPTVGFREENSGREYSKATYQNVSVAMDILDASFRLDIAVANADERGKAARMAQELSDHMRAAMYLLEDQIWNGSDAVGFSSLPSQIDASMLIASDTPTGDEEAAPLYMLHTGPTGVGMIMGELGRINVGDETVIEADDGTGKWYPALYVPVTGYVGLQVLHKYAAAGKNASVTIDDDTIDELYSSFPIGMRNNLLIVTNRTGMKKLRQSRTATSPTGSPAPYPTTWNAVTPPIPILETDALADTVATTTS